LPLQNPNITETELVEVERLLTQYREATQKEWTSMVGKVRDLDITCNDNETKAHDILKAEVPRLELDGGVKNLFTAFKVSKQEVPHDPNLYKKIFAGVLGFIGVAIGVALTATGVLAPLGIGLIATIAIAAVAGGAIGVSAGLASGSVIDALKKPESTEILEINLDELKKQKQEKDQQHVESEVVGVKEGIHQSEVSVKNDSYATMLTREDFVRSEPSSENVKQGDKVVVVTVAPSTPNEEQSSNYGNKI